MSATQQVSKSLIFETGFHSTDTTLSCTFHLIFPTVGENNSGYPKIRNILVHSQIIFFKVAIVELDFSLLLPIKLSTLQLITSKSCRPWPLHHLLFQFCTLIRWFSSVLLPCIITLFLNVNLKITSFSKGRNDTLK